MECIKDFSMDDRWFVWIPSYCGLCLFFPFSLTLLFSLRFLLFSSFFLFFVFLFLCSLSHLLTQSLPILLGVNSSFVLGPKLWVHGRCRPWGGLFCMNLWASPFRAVKPSQTASFLLSPLLLIAHQLTYHQLMRGSLGALWCGKNATRRFTCTSQKCGKD